jgi:hypothetical protein
MNAAVPIGMALAAPFVALSLLYPDAVAQAPPPSELCMDADTRDKTRALMFDGLNNALTHQAEKLFDNLLKDRGHEPDRITRGLEGSLKLYVRSRANLLAWSPLPCKE